MSKAIAAGINLFLLLFILSFPHPLSISQVWAAENLRVTVLNSSASRFEGVLTEREAAGGKDKLRFSSVQSSTGIIEVLFSFPEAEKEYRAVADSSGVVHQVVGRSKDGAIVKVADSDKQLLAALAEGWAPRYQPALVVQSVMARVLGFIVELVPEGSPLEIAFSKEPQSTALRNFSEEAAPATSASYCWEMDSIVKYLIGVKWVLTLDQGYYHGWLAAHGWEYRDAGGAFKSVCGFSQTDICAHLGTIYRGRAGYISTQEWPQDLFVPPTEYFEEAWNNDVRVGFPGRGSFCPGRCGPGCFGKYGKKLGSFSAVTYTAECLAHDLCTGAVAGDAADPNIYAGEGYACVDEFLNASWSYMNGPACRSNTDTAELQGWWQFKVAGGKIRNLKFSKKGVFEVKRSLTKPKKIGTYTYIANVEGKKILQVQGTRGWLSRGALFSAVVQPRSGLPPSALVAVDGAYTKSGNSVESVEGRTLFYGGIVADSETRDPLEGVQIKLKAVRLGRKSRGMKGTTGSDGQFFWGGPQPFTTYAVTFSKPGFKTAAYKNVAKFISNSQLHGVLLQRLSPAGENFDESFSYNYRGQDFTVVNKGTFSGPGVEIYERKLREPVQMSLLVDAESGTLLFNYEMGITTPNGKNTWAVQEGDCVTRYALTNIRYQVAYGTAVSAAGAIENRVFKQETGKFSVSETIYPTGSGGHQQLMSTLYGTIDFDSQWETSCPGQDTTSGTDGVYIPVLTLTVW